MIEALPPYPEMRDSGVEWLGEVPAHWEVVPNRALFDEREVCNLPDEPMLSVTIGKGIVRQADLLEETSKKDSSNLDRSKYKLVEPGDIAYNKMRCWQGAIGLSKHRGIVSPAYIVMRPFPDIDGGFYDRLLRTPAFATEAERWSYGITSDQWSLRSHHFKMIYCPKPPPEEQAAIVRFLADADRRIGGVLAAKQRLVALLEEAKAAIVHRAVTKGLNPAAPAKASGIPWLGDVPAHWDVVRVKDVFDNLNTKRVPLSSEERGKMQERKYDYYGASGIIDRVDDFLFDDDLLLIAEDGANLVLRNLPLAIIARGKFWVNNHAHILKPKSGDLSYLANYMQGIDFRPWITGAAQPKLTQDRLMSVRIAVAPEAEQAAISEKLTTETATLNQAIATARAEIDLLREYRTRLIADVVTGKRDVRAAAAALPDIADDTPSSPALADLLGDETEDPDESIEEQEAA